MKVIIQFASYSVEADIFDSPTGRAVYNGLPIQNNTNTWGDEIYFAIPMDVTLEPEAKAEVAVGDLAYWPNMPAFCIFFGATPASTGETPVAASPVNVFGRLLEINLEQLRRIPDGENVTIKRI